MGKGEGCSQIGGVIERGTILAKVDNLYNVLSLDRPGISIFSIRPINDAEYNVNDKIVFFSFSDGTGRIVCEL